MKHITYVDIAMDYKLWMEYADPSGIDTEADFQARSFQDKINFLTACFGPENEKANTH